MKVVRYLFDFLLTTLLSERNILAIFLYITNNWHLIIIRYKIKTYIFVNSSFTVLIQRKIQLLETLREIGTYQ